MTRLLVRLRARSDAAYQTAYHDKLRGCLGNALEGTRHEETHESDEMVGVTYSNIFPWGEMAEGDERSLLIASPHEDALAAVAETYPEGAELNVGEMPFRVTGASALDVDVGEPGTTGVLETATGVYTRLADETCAHFGITTGDGDGDEYWKPGDSLGAFEEYVTANLQYKHDRFCFDHQPGPAEVDGRLFDTYECLKSFSIPLTVTQGTTITTVLTKWRLEYTVRDDHHRRHLNLALDCGIGGRNALGLGFVNDREVNA